MSNNARFTMEVNGKVYKSDECGVCRREIDIISQVMIHELNKIKEERNLLQSAIYYEVTSKA